SGTTRRPPCRARSPGSRSTPPRSPPRPTTQGAPESLLRTGAGNVGCGMRWGAAVLAVLAVACGGSSPSPPAAAAQARHVFWIVMEKHSADEALSGQYTASLAAKYRVAENYHAVAHPSVPNYLAMTSGSTWGVQDDSYRVLPKQDLGTQLT